MEPKHKANVGGMQATAGTQTKGFPFFVGIFCVHFSHMCRSPRVLEKSTGLKSKWQKTTGLTLEQADGCPTEISSVRFFLTSEG